MTTPVVMATIDLRDPPKSGSRMLTVKVDPTDVVDIKNAAHICRMNMADFLRVTAIRTAREVIAQDEASRNGTQLRTGTSG